ncbi:MAG: AbrB/MazE/SpoVT family DNA-binding domain-containing protein [Verrucomicrobia bacterium]|nr:MAG: AbrB/MazE/SpoVT family DNA-binding domain-containing protein [Verrucomicrobiota bacterium]
MKTVVQQWGNSLAVRIPRHIARESHIGRGTRVEVSIANGNLVLTPLSKCRSYSLASLVRKITPANRHAEIDFGRPVGHEVW